MLVAFQADMFSLNRADANTKNAFPSAYEFTNSADAEALARRAARFQQPAASFSTSAHAHASHAGGLNHWFGDEDDDDEETDGADRGDVIMMGEHQLGRKKLKGKGGMGYPVAEVLEVDPVSCFTALGYVVDRRSECHELGQVYNQGHEYKARKALSQTDIGTLNEVTLMHIADHLGHRSHHLLIYDPCTF